MKLDGKTALVTGGSRGIGKAIAKEFAKNGATIVISGKDKTKLEQTAKEIGAFAIPADMRRELEVQNLISKTVERFGKLDILVNNAGIFPQIKLLHEISDSEWRDVLDVNLNGPFYATKYSIPHLQKNGGAIINIASDAGLKAYEDFNADAYSASKAALVLLTKCWALEYAKNKIRVNCICPGVVETDMTTEFLASPAMRDMMNLAYPIGRFGTVNDVAKAALFFASEEDSSWVTGTILPLDGGESIK